MDLSVLQYKNAPRVDPSRLQGNPLRKFLRPDSASPASLFLAPELLSDAYVAAVAWTEGTGGIVEQVLPEKSAVQANLMAFLDARSRPRAGSHHFQESGVRK